MVCIGPSGFFVIEVKHWDRAFLKSNQTAVLKEATKLNDKVRRLVGKLRRASIDTGFVAGRFLLTKDGVRWDGQRPEFHGGQFFGLSEWKQLLDVESGAIFSEATIQQASEIIQPLSKVALRGDIRRIADVRNHGTTFKVLELDGDREVGCFAAKVVYDKTGGERALKAFRSARLPSGESPFLATIETC